MDIVESLIKSYAAQRNKLLRVLENRSRRQREDSSSSEYWRLVTLEKWWLLVLQLLKWLFWASVEILAFSYRKYNWIPKYN